MKKTLIISTLIFAVVACGVVDIPSLPTSTTSTQKPALTNDEVIRGLKEALTVGIKNSIDSTSISDGFLKNAAIQYHPRHVHRYR